MINLLKSAGGLGARPVGRFRGVVREPSFSPAAPDFGGCGVKSWFLRGLPRRRCCSRSRCWGTVTMTGWMIVETVSAFRASSFSLSLSSPLVEVLSELDSSLLDSLDDFTSASLPSGG